MTNRINFPGSGQIQEYVLWPLIAVCLVLGAVSTGTERALYFLAAIFLFAFSRSRASELFAMIAEVQKRLAALSRELVETSGAFDRRVVIIESEVKRLGADLEALKVPPPRPAVLRAVAAGVFALLFACGGLYLLIDNQVQRVALRLDNYESNLEGARERLGNVAQRSDELLNRVSLTEGRVNEISTDVRERLVSAFAQCLKPAAPVRYQSSQIIREPVNKQPIAVNPPRQEPSPLNLVVETSGTNGASIRRQVEATEEPRASASFNSFSKAP